MTKTLAYKGFTTSMTCRDFQFEVGKTYEAEGDIKACHNGFHACEYPLAVFEYYAPAGSRYALVEIDGDMDREGDKIAARKITIVRELTLREIILDAARYTTERAKIEEGATASGDQGAATASGCQGAATASGDQGAATASGYQGAATASGTRGAATASGCQGAATASGYQGAATASGTRGAATASGTRGAATASGTRGAATASGFYGKVSGKVSNALFLVERRDSGGSDHGEITNVWAGIVGKDGIDADTFYTLVDGKPVKAQP